MPQANGLSLEPRGLPRLLWDIVVRPRSALAYVGAQGRRTWWLPALLALLFVVLPVVVAAPITARESREAVAALQEQLAEDMPADALEQMEGAMSIVASPLITLVFPAIGGSVGRVASWAAWAGALYLASVALGGKSSFSQLFPIVVWAGLPYAVRGALQTVYVWASGELILNPGFSGLVSQTGTVADMVTASPSTGQQLLSAILSRVDVFVIWHLALLVIGVLAATHLSRRKTILITLGIWALFTGLSLIPILIGAAFTQMAAIGP